MLSGLHSKLTRCEIRFRLLERRSFSRVCGKFGHVDYQLGQFIFLNSPLYGGVYDRFVWLN